MAHQMRFDGVPDVRTTPATLTNIAGGDIVDKINSALAMVARMIGESESNNGSDIYPPGSEFRIKAELVITTVDDAKLDVFGGVKIVLPGMRGIKTKLFFGRNNQFVIPVVNRDEFERGQFDQNDND